MAKNTKAQEAATGTSDSYTAEEASDPRAPVVIRRAMLGDVDNPLISEEPTDAELEDEEESSSVSKVEDGTDSSASSESASKTSKSVTQDPRKPAQTTESHYSTTGAESSDAPSMAGHGLEAERNQSGKPAKKANPTKKASTRVISDDFDEFN